MLSLNVKRGEYITIGENTVVQVLPDGNQATLLIDAPREVPVWRGTLLEEQGVERPKVLDRELPKRSARKKGSPSYKRRLDVYSAKQAIWKEQRDAAAAAVERIRQKLARPGAETFRDEILRELDWIIPLTTSASTAKEEQNERDGQPE